MPWNSSSLSRLFFMQNLVLFNVKYSQGLYSIVLTLHVWLLEELGKGILWHLWTYCIWIVLFLCLSDFFILYWILIAFKGQVKNVFTLSFLIKQLNSMFVALIVYNFGELTQVCNPWCSWWWNFSFYKLWLELQWLLSLLNYFILNWQIVFLMELHWEQSVSVWN